MSILAALEATFRMDFCSVAIKDEEILYQELFG